MTRRTHSTRPPRTRAGFTLIEMIVSMVIAVILMATMTSAIVLATHALPSDDNDAAATVTTARVIQKLRHELQQAIHLTERTAASVTMVLPDQNGDAAPELIRYAWAGSAGDPLTRQRNGNTPVIVLDHLDAFALAYHAVDRTVAFPGIEVESAEQVFSSYESVGILSHILVASDWIGTHVQPSLPADATAWRITRARFYGQKKGAAGSTATFELRGWDGTAPASTVLDQFDLHESEMGTTWDWHEATFSTNNTFAAGNAASIVLTNHGGGQAGWWEFTKDDAGPSAMFTTTDGGTNWNAGSIGDELNHTVYGTYTAPGDDWAFTRPRVTEVSLSLTLSRSPGRPYNTTVVLPNAPDALSKLWEADFASDPLALDLDADGTPDFTGTFNTGRISDGIWALQNGLQLEPADYAFSQPTTLDLSLRDVTEDGTGGGVRWRCDRGGGQHATIVVRINAVGGQQALMVKSTDATGAVTLWHLTTADANEWVRLRLILDPANDRAAVRINGDDQGAFPLFGTADTGQPSLDFFDEANNAGVQLDHLSLRVGGTVSVAAVGTGP